MENGIRSEGDFGNSAPPQTSPAAWVHLVARAGGRGERGHRRWEHEGSGLEARPHLMFSTILSLISSSVDSCVDGEGIDFC